MDDSKLGFLWGATLDSIRLDVVQQRVALDVHTRNRGKVNEYKILLSEVSDFRFSNDIEGPWDYAEITEVHVARLAEQTLTLEFVLWSEGAGLRVKCSTVFLNGQSMIL